jgi:hypothetical protein
VKSRYWDLISVELEEEELEKELELETPVLELEALDRLKLELELEVLGIGCKQGGPQPGSAFLVLRRRRRFLLANVCETK